MRKQSLLASFTLVLFAAACSSAGGVASDSDSGSDGADDGGAVVPGASTGGGANTAAGTGGSTVGGPDPSCPMMCEVQETVSVPVEGGGPMCTAPEFVGGTGYVGGSVVSFEGSEYTSNYWTDISPAVSSGTELGLAWGEGVPCPGGGGATEEMVVTSYVCCEAQPTEAPPATQTCPLDSIMGEAQFNTWFSARRDPFYSYANLCIAIESFPGFASSGDDTQNRREVAAFFANVARETGELDYIDQFPESRGNTGNYFGRGPIQITWDYNYIDAGESLGLDLHGNPALVSTDGVVTWQTALWFWMEADGAGKGTCHDAILSGNFGQTINIINGGLECFAGNEAADQRINYYVSFSQLLGVDPGSQLQCW